MATTFTNLLYHIVFSTKNRVPLIHEAIRERIYEYLGGVIRGEKGTLLEIGGVPDHVHLLVRLRAEPSVAVMLRNMKSNSSRWLNEEVNPGGQFGWQIGYGAFSVSESQVGKVRRYIQNQENHHRKVSFRDELIDLLRKHGIEYDERYLLD
jgi:putative transposase